MHSFFNDYIILLTYNVYLFAQMLRSTVRGRNVLETLFSSSLNGAKHCLKKKLELFE